MRLVVDAVAAEVLLGAVGGLATLAGKSGGIVGRVTRGHMTDQRVERLEVVAVIQDPPHLRLCMRLCDSHMPIAASTKGAVVER